jgi:hypothetical protein
MKWPVFCGIVLVVLTVAVFADSLQVTTETSVYFTLFKWYPEYFYVNGIEYYISYPVFVPFVNISSLGPLNESVKDYCVGCSQITDEVLVSDSASSIRSWAESMFSNGERNFYVVVDNQTYIGELYSTEQIVTLGSQVNFNEALFIVTVGLWAILFYSDYRERHLEAMPKAVISEIEN